jgi:hypothetical protein
MTLSLTKDEFCQRLIDRSDLLGVALKRDLDKVFPLKATSTPIRQYQSEMDVIMDVKPLIELIMKEMKRLIELAYDENL